jgi:hypothetical protein
MNLLRRLQSRLSPYAIPNLTGVLVAGQVLLYLLRMVRSADNGLDPLAHLYFEPGAILSGEVWRFVTFLFIPPDSAPLWAVVYWMVFYFFGSALEQHWGTVRYNGFLLVGYLANVLAACIAWWAGSIGFASNSFLYGTVFLAFARLFPDFIMNIMFILPIQIKWLALLAWITYGYIFASSDWMGKLLVLASLANYFYFFGSDHWREFRQGHRRRSFQARAASGARPTHECRVCGLTSESSPKTAFRYCSKCAGQCCYCPEHIQDHEHLLEDV